MLLGRDDRPESTVEDYIAAAAVLPAVTSVESGDSPAAVVIEIDPHANASDLEATAQGLQGRLDDYKYPGGDPEVSATAGIFDVEIPDNSYENIELGYTLGAPRLEALPYYVDLGGIVSGAFWKIGDVVLTLEDDVAAVDWSLENLDGRPRVTVRVTGGGEKVTLSADAAENPGGGLAALRQVVGAADRSGTAITEYFDTGDAQPTVTADVDDSGSAEEFTREVGRTGSAVRLMLHRPDSVISLGEVTSETADELTDHLAAEALLEGAGLTPAGISFDETTEDAEGMGFSVDWRLAAVADDAETLRAAAGVMEGEDWPLPDDAAVAFAAGTGADVDLQDGVSIVRVDDGPAQLDVLAALWEEGFGSSLVSAAYPGQLHDVEITLARSAGDLTSPSSRREVIAALRAAGWERTAVVQLDDGSDADRDARDELADALPDTMEFTSTACGVASDPKDFGGDGDSDDLRPEFADFIEEWDAGAAC